MGERSRVGNSLQLQTVLRLSVGGYDGPIVIEAMVNTLMRQQVLRRLSVDQ